MDEIIEVIGYEAALLLARHYGGCSLYIPLQKNLSLAKRNQLIKEDSLTGMPVNDLARKYQLTTRRIFSILARSVPAIP